MRIRVPELAANITGLRMETYNDLNLAVLAQLQYDNGYEEEVPVSVNIPNFAKFLGEGEFFAKNWSEGESVFNALENSGTLVVTDRAVQTGYVMAPVCYLSTSN